MTDSASLTVYPKQLATSWLDGWNEFWFTPKLPHTLCMIRILVGAMMLYSHLVLAANLTDFLGDDAWVSNEMSRQLHDGSFGLSDWGRSYLWWISSPTVLWTHHSITLAVTAMFMLGCLTRLTGPAACFLQLMYIHRLTGALFGLDQIVTYTTMYLMFSPCGSRYSVDSWLRSKWSAKRKTSSFWRWMLPSPGPSVSANIATRLLQLHLCVIYLFGGLAKARGESWWDGTAVWFAVANYEYQSADMTWLANYPIIISFLSNLTLFWEIFFCALIWPKATRPFVLFMVVAVHGGIGLFLGMITFGLMMIFANGVFLHPEFIARITGDTRLVDALADRRNPADETDHAGDSTGENNGPTARQIRSGLAKLNRKKVRYREFSAKLKRRQQRLKEREQKYKKRVKRLRERESKIKDVVEKRRERKAGESRLGGGEESPETGSES